MAIRHNIEKSSTDPNQPHLQEVKYLSISSKEPFEVPSDLTKEYPPEIPTQPTLDMCYTYSPDILHQDPSSNKELQGVSSK
jgi:hypothetical protein